MKRMYVAAPTPTQSRSPTTSPSRNRPGDRLVWLTGAVPAATSSVVKTANDDEVAEGEVDDPRQAVDERVPDGEEPVDAAGGEAGDDHLDDEAHGGTLLRARPGCEAAGSVSAE